MLGLVVLVLILLVLWNPGKATKNHKESMWVQEEILRTQQELLAKRQWEDSIRDKVLGRSNE